MNAAKDCFESQFASSRFAVLVIGLFGLCPLGVGCKQLLDIEDYKRLTQSKSPVEASEGGVTEFSSGRNGTSDGASEGVVSGRSSGSNSTAAETSPVSISVVDGAIPTIDASVGDAAAAICDACLLGGSTGAVADSDASFVDHSASDANCESGGCTRASSSSTGPTCPTPPANCSGSGTACDGDVVEICTLDSDGCLVVSDTAVCEGSLICTGTFPDAMCDCPYAAECDEGGERDGSYCSGDGNLTVCSEDVQGCPAFDATACRLLGTERCVGSHPSAACEVAYGDGTASEDDFALPALYLYAVQVTLPELTIVDRIGFLGSSVGEVTFAIYSSTAGEPDAFIARTATAAVTPGRNEYPIAVPTNLVTLPAGTYWIALMNETALDVQYSETVATRRLVDVSDGIWRQAFPDPFPTGTPTTAETVKFYLIGVPQ